MDVPASMPKPYPPDRVAGGLMFAGFLAIDAYGVWNGLYLNHLLPGHEGRLPILPTGLGYLWRLLAFVIQAWYSLGVLRSRPWAFVIATFVAAQGTVLMIDQASNFQTERRLFAFPVFTLLVFVYCGLRMVGAFGPKSADRLDLRG